MKKHLPLFLLLLGGLGLRAQVSFFDDIESYNVGANIAVTSNYWQTWSGNVVGEDAKVSTEQAHSGTKSIKLITTSANGGPTDLMLPFGGSYTSGDLAIDFWMFVATGRGGYFNFQKETTTGVGWAADFRFDKNGLLTVNTNGDSEPAITNGSYPNGAWFNMKINIDLTNNVWEVLVDNVSQGKFSNNMNQTAGINFFAFGPTGSLGQYYLDDVNLTYTPAALPAKDASLYTINARTLGLAGQVIPVTGTIRNTGTEAITSFDAVIGTETVSVTGINVASLDLYSFTQSVPYTLLAGDQTIAMEIKNVNAAGADGNPNNNTKTSKAKGYVAAPGKAVVVEEATGTWCQWCPRGTVFMDRMDNWYPNHFIGIAVHNNDPMEVAEYDAGVTSFPGFTGFPNVIVQREAVMNPASMELPILDRLVLPPAVLVNNGATYDQATGELNISVTGDFLEDLDNNGDEYRFNAVVTEDDMHGTTSAWAQVNAYANNAAGPMGGFESLPNPVPAAQMYYDHVARGILGTFGGAESSLPFDIVAGSKHTAGFSYQVEAGSDPNKMHIVGMVLGPDGKVINARKSTIADAVAAGYVTGTNDLDAKATASISPNPAGESTNIALYLPKSAEASVRIFDQTGRLAAERFYGNLFGQQILPIQTGSLSSGVYSVQVILGKEVLSQKLIVRH